MDSRADRGTSAGLEPSATGARPASSESVGSRAESSWPPCPTGPLHAAGAQREGQPRPSDSRENSPEFHSQPAILGVKSVIARSCENERREPFRPTPEQITQARAWLVRVVARRAVEILQAQEKAP